MTDIRRGYFPLAPHDYEAWCRLVAPLLATQCVTSLREVMTRPEVQACRGLRALRLWLRLQPRRCPLRIRYGQRLVYAEGEVGIRLAG